LIEKHLIPASTDWTAAE